MTIKQLRAALAALDPQYDHCRVVIFLPGSRIDLGGREVFMMNNSHIDAHNFESEGTREVMLIEGNLRPGSVLS